MPSFGEFETVGEPYANTYFQNYITTVWRARKSGEASASALYAVKCIAPRRREVDRAGHADDKLEADGGLEFIEVFKQIKKAQSEQGRGLAPILAFGTAEAGAWYATDFCERSSLKALVNRQGQVDDAALRHVIYSVVTGCLALKRSCSRSHGNLKLSNVLRGGRNQVLRKTPLLLVDPMPVPSATISHLAGADRQNVGGMVHDVFEAQDLKAIGEMILQLVEGRIIESGFDYNYPVALSAAWSRLGKSGESWRDLCNQLLDPQLSIDRVNLNWLAEKVKPTSTGRNLGIVASVLLGLGLVAGGVYLMRSRPPTQPAKVEIKPPPKTPSEPAGDQEPKMALQAQIGELLKAGQTALTGGDNKTAVAKAEAIFKLDANNAQALTLRQNAQSAQKILDDQTGKAAQIGELLKAGQTALTSGDNKTAVTKAEAVLKLDASNAQALTLRQSAQSAQKILDDQTGKATQIGELLKAGQMALTGGDNKTAVAKAEAVIKLDANNAQALTLRQSAQSAQKIFDDQAAKATQIGELLKAGQAALTGGDNKTAVAKAEAVIKLDANNAQAVTLKQNAQSAQKILDDQAAKAAQIGELLKAGQVALTGGDNKTAVAKAEAVIKLDANNAQAVTLRQNAQSAQKILDDQAAKVAQIGELLKAGQAALTGGDNKTAVAKAEAVIKLDANNAQAVTLKQNAQSAQKILDDQAAKAAQIGELLKAGQVALTGGDNKTAVAKAEAVIKLDANNAQAVTLRQNAQSAQKILDDQAAKVAQIGELLKAGQAALTGGDNKTAVAKAEAVLKLDASNAEATMLRQSAQSAQKILDDQAAKAAQQKQISELLKAGQDAVAGGDNKTAVAKAGAVLQLDPSNAQAQTMRQNAQQALDIQAAKDKQAADQLLQLDKTLEILLDSFGVNVPTGIRSPGGKKHGRLGALGSSAKQYQGQVDQLENAYQAGKWLGENNRQPSIAALRKAIDNWD